MLESAPASIYKQSAAISVIVRFSLQLNLNCKTLSIWIDYFDKVAEVNHKFYV